MRRQAGRQAGRQAVTRRKGTFLVQKHNTRTSININIAVMSEQSSLASQTILKRAMQCISSSNTTLKIAVFLQLVVSVQSLHAASNMPPMDLSGRRHTSDFSARKNHPAAYEDSPKFKGPLTLTEKNSTSDNRTRIKNFYEDSDDLRIPERQLNPLKPSANTDLILKTIMDNFALNDAPVDAKEMAESMEFYMRTRKRLLGVAKKRIAKISNDRHKGGGSEEENQIVNIHVYDLCAGHGLTGMLFAACNPPREDIIVRTHLVDISEPPSHKVLKDLIAEVCPWIKNEVQFNTCSLKELHINDSKDVCPIVIATHACGNLTDEVLDEAVSMNACAIAAMPCCYTGTAKGSPYGIKRALGVAWAADIRRTQFLDSNQYHVDYSTIPIEITPLNRIILAEERI